MTSASTVTVNGSGNRSPAKEREKEMEKEKDETQQADHSPSRFTAVNGRDTNMTGMNGNGNGNGNGHPGMVNGSGGGSGSGSGNENGNGSGIDERPDSRDAAKTSFADQVHDHEHEHARGPAHDPPPPPETANGSSPPYPNPPQHHPPPPTERSSHRSTADERERGPSSNSQLPPSRMSSSPHKRKRSYSQERQHQISTPTSFHRHSLPKSPPSSNYPRLDDENDDRTSSNGTWNGEYDAGGPQHTPNRHSLDASDAQLAEALQRNNQEQDARQQNGWPPRPEDEAGPDSQHFANYTSDQRSSQGAQVGPKRKRVFSNRTKTGCMTCRRRKKKCDEGQPQCNNCTRGGFTCEGYTSRNTWQKPSNAKGPIPLQSKDGYPEIPGQHLTTQEMSPVHTHRHSMHHPDGSSIQPILVDDRDQMRQPYITSPTAPTPHSQGGWGKTWPPTSSNPSQPPPAPPPHVQERVPKDYRDIPPITELTNQPPRSEYPMMPPIHELSRGQPSKPLYQQGPNQRSDYGSMPRLDMSDSQAQAHQMKAKMALEHSRTIDTRAMAEHSRAIAHRNSHYDEPEKDKMLRGDQYRPHDPVLTDERERCKLALYRFNNAGNPFTGFTPNEQRRLLRELIQPARPIAGSPSSTSSVATGSVAPDCLVEAPFSCQYGYNISIASQVHISEGCKIIDARPVTIGARTWIGPGVTIQTTMPDPHFGHRKGKDSPWLARPITIGDMCWIGAGAVIMPGVHIQTGAYVAPNEVVKKDVLGFGPPVWRFD